MRARLPVSLVLPVVLFAAHVASALRAADAPAAPAAATESNGIPGLLSKMFSPRLEMTVFTDFTALGRMRPPASANSPLYYVLHTTGRREVGARPSTKPVDAASIQRHLQHALAINGYLTADEEHPASLLIVYGWGSHTSGADDSVDAAFRTLLDRAALVGGDKFADELGRLVRQRLALADASAPPLGRGSNSDSMDLGAAAGLQQMNAMMDPVKLFVQKSVKNDFLVRQAAEDCY